MCCQKTLTTFKISGLHTFDQQIDYYIQAPLRRKKKSRDATFTSLDPDKTKVYLSITGTTDDYEVALDKKATFREIKGSILRVFKDKKKQKQQEVELSEDEYFDFEEADQR